MKQKRFLTILAIVLLVVTGIICALPYLLTRCGVVDFTQTGQIGDTIGGIMSPFVGIIAAALTFLAFWIQYEANADQRNSIAENREEIKKQQERYERDHFESKLMMLLNMYRETVESMKYADVSGRPVFKELLEELQLIYELVEYGYTKWVRDGMTHRRPEYADKVITFQNKISADDDVLRSFLTETAYTLFFYGYPYFTTEETKNNPGKIVVVERIYGEIRKVGSSISPSATKHFGVSSMCGDIVTYRYSAPQNIFQGESFQLALYFRLLYSLAQFIDKADIAGVGFDEKYEYFKLLRCQMSDEEQALFFYNSISPLGLSWNKLGKNNDMGLIAKYRLIKNLSPRFPFFGIIPMEYYSTEIKTYEDKGKHFFEHESFLKYDSKVFVEKKSDDASSIIFKLL